MKIAVTCSGKKLEDKLDQRFGRAPYFLLVDSDTMKYTVIDESSDKPTGGAGIAAAQNLLDKGVETVITGQLGPNAFRVLQAAGLDLYQGIPVSAEDSIRAWKENKLERITTVGPSHFGQRGGKV